MTQVPPSNLPPSQISVKDVKDAVMEVLSNRTTVPDPVMKERDKMSKDFLTKAKKQEKLIEDNTKQLKESFEEIKKLVSEMKEQRKQADKLTEATKKSAERTHDVIEMFEKMSKGGGSGGSGPGTPGGLGGGMGGAGGGAGKMAVELAKSEKSMNNIVAKAGEYTLLAMGGKQAWLAIFGGLQEQLQFGIQMKQIAFETQGITRDTADLQKKWMDTGKVVAQTGQNIGVFQNALLTNLRRGVQSRKEEITLMKSGLNLATMISADAGQTASLFHDWHMHMGMSNIQMAQMSRSVQAIARDTGVTGDNLMNAVKASERFVRAMRNASTLTESAAANFVRMQVIAEKLGIGEEAAVLNESLASSTTMYLKASKETQALLFGAAGSVGKIQELTTGQLGKSRSGAKAMAQGLENIMRRFGASADELDRMSPERLRNLNMQLQSVYGMESGQIKKLIDAYKDAGKSVGDQMDEINKSLASGNLTTQERINLEKKLQKIQMDKGLEYLTSFAEAGKKTGTTIEEAVSQTMKKMGPDMQEDLRKMGISEMGPMEQLSAVAEKTAMKLKESGGKDFTADLKKAIGSRNIGEIREVLEKMNAEQQKVGVDTAKKLDPMLEMGQQMNQMNEWFRTTAGPILNGILAGIGAAGLTLIYIAAQVAAASKSGGLISKGLSMLVGGGKSAAGGVAEKTTGAGAGILEKIFGKGGSGGGGGGGGGGGLLSKLKLPSIGGAVGGAGGGMGFSIKDIWKGGMALLAIAPLILLIATALLLMAKVISKVTGFDAAKAGKVALDVAGIIGAVGVVALAVVGASFGLAVLGALASEAEAMIEFMALGAVALLILTPVMLLLATAFLLFVKGIMWVISKVMSLEEARKVGEGVASLMMSAGMVALAVAGAAGALVGLGLLAAQPWIWWAMGIGAVALFALTPVTILLAQAIIGLASQAMKWVGVDQAANAKVAEDLGNLLMSAGKIALGVLATAGSLIALGALAPFVGWAVLLMLLGVAAMTALTPVVVKLAASLITFVSEVVGSSGIDEKMAEKTVKIMNAMSSVLKSLRSVLQDLSEAIMPLISGKLFNTSSIFGLLMIIGKFRFAFQVISLFVKTGIIEPVIATFNNTRDINKAKKIIVAMGKMFKEMGPTLQTISDVVVPFVSGDIPFFSSSPATKLKNKIPKFKKAWKAIAEFVKEGLVDVTNEVFQSTRGIGHATRIIKSIGKMFESLLPIMNGVSDGIVKFVTGGWFTDSPAEIFEKHKDEFKDSFKSIAKFIKDGMLGTILETFQFKESKNIDGKIEEVDVTSKTLTKVGRVLKKIAPIIENVFKIMGSFSQLKGGEKSGGFWSSVSGLFGGGGEEGIDASKMAMALHQFTVEFPRILYSLKAGIIEPLEKGMGNIKFSNASRILSGIARLLNKIPKIMGSLKDMSGFGGAMIMAKMGDALDNIATGIIKYFPDQSKLETAFNKADKARATLEAILAIMADMAKLAQDGMSVQDAVNNLGPVIDSLNASGTAGAGGIPEYSRGVVSQASVASTASAAPMDVAYDRVSRNNAANTSAANKSGSGFLSAVAAASDKQLSALVQLHQDNLQIISLLSSEGRSPSTKTNMTQTMVAADPNLGTLRLSNNPFSSPSRQGTT